MKRKLLALSTLFAFGLYACQKNNSASQISLTPSTTAATVGETVTVSLSGNANASNWTVTPSATATKTYTLTSSKVNYFQFNAPGVYTVSVRAKSIDYDSTHQTLNAAWNASGASRGSCTPGVDTASATITVAK